MGHDAGDKRGGARRLDTSEVNLDHEETAGLRGHAAVPLGRQLAQDSVAVGNPQGRLHQSKGSRFTAEVCVAAEPHQLAVSTGQTELMSGVYPTQHCDTDVSMHFPPQITLLDPDSEVGQQPYASPSRYVS